MPLTIDYQPVLDTADLYRRAPKQVRTAMNRAVNREVNPWLRSAIRRGAGTDVERKIASTARVRAGTNPAVVVGGATRFSGGASASVLAGAYEFGAHNPYRKITYTRRSPAGTVHRVRRSTAAQIPPHRSSGRFIMDAVATAAPMLVSAWVHTIIDAYSQE